MEVYFRKSTFNSDPPPPPPSDTIEPKSIVDLLKAVQNSKKSETSQGDRTKVDSLDAICAKNVSEAPQRLLSQLRTMDKDGVKDLINNPKQPYKKKVINFQAREKLREQMRKKLKDLGSDTGDFQIEPDECIDYDRIPESLIAQIGQTLDLQEDGDDIDMSETMNEDLEVVKTNLGHDFLMGSEMLLMNGFSLLAETDTEAESKVFKDEFPPLPIETVEKPPSPPPEPVPPPEAALPDSIPIFSSVDKPWSPIPARPVVSRLAVDADDWDFEGARNPDPPELNNVPPPVPPVSAKIKDEKEDKKDPPNPEPVARPPSVVNDRPPSKVNDRRASTADRTPSSNSGAAEQSSEQPVESARRANETYGDYRRRLAAERDANRESIEKQREERIENRPQEKLRQENLQNSANDDDRNRFRNQPGPRDKWMNNNRRNIHQNDSGPRKTRFEMDRDHQRNSSRDASNSFDNARNIKVEPDGHNYRLQKDSKEPEINQLNSMLHPKPLQFSGSFNKRAQEADRSRSRNRRHNNGRSASRDRTPVNNSFNETLLAPLNDARPCLATLRKVMELDAEMGKIHEKIHGIDKVISNLQLERVGHQKSFARLQHDRKVLFDNLMKRATSSTNDLPVRIEKSNSKEPFVQHSTSQKCQNEKKAESNVEKRKSEDQELEPVAKKKIVSSFEETTSAAEKAAKIQKQREEEERKKHLAEKKRLKRLRREREEAERTRLDEKIRQEAIAATVTTIKLEPRDKSTDRHSEKSKHKSYKEKPVKEVRQFIFSRDEAIDPENHKIRDFKISLSKVSLGEELIEQYKVNHFLAIAVSDWENWTSPVPAEKSEDVTQKTINVETTLDLPAMSKAADVEASKDEELLVVEDANEDPLGIVCNISNPPTPGSSFTANEDSMLVEIPTVPDYSEWTGTFNSHDQPIVFLQLVNKHYIVCASENGKLYKYTTGGGLLAVFSKHTDICNSFMYSNNGLIYTASSDGFLYQIKFKVSCPNISLFKI